METGKVKIVTDSSAYLDPETVAKHDIRVVPLRIGFGTKFYREGIDITNEEFYQRLAGAKKLPTTSQPPVGDFSKVYGELVAGGHSILSIHISGLLSGTINAALVAKKEYPEAQIEVVDSLFMPLRFFVVPAAQAAERGRPLPEIKDYVEKIIKSVNVVAMLDTVEYLWKGGRIGRAKALLGTLLNIKPIITVQGGEVDALTKVRSKAKGMEYMLDFAERRARGSTSMHAGIIHINAPEAALALKEKVQARFNPVELEVVEFGPVLATYMGPGALALGFHTVEESWAWSSRAR